MGTVAGSSRGGRWAAAGLLFVLLVAGPTAGQSGPPVMPLSPAGLPPPPVYSTPTVATAPMPPMPQTTAPKDDATTDGKTDKAAKASSESEEKDVTVHLGGRAQFDVANYMVPRALREVIPGTFSLEDGVSFRRLRLNGHGTIYKTIDYMVEIDFVNALDLGPGGPPTTDVAVPTDVWFTFRELPVVGNLRVGNHKPWLSFEHLTSSRFLNFLERSLGFDAFVEGFNNGFAPGISVFDTYLYQRGTWGVGLFKTTRNPFAFNVGTNEADLNGRVTFLPVYQDDGRFLVHVGLGAAHRDLDDGQARFRSRFDVRNSPGALAELAADTGLFPGSRQQLLVPEFAMVCGPLSVQAEYYASWVTGAEAGPADARVPQGTVFFQSAYIEAHLFLTGEHREYDRDMAVFDRVKPRRPLTWSRCGFTGCGAWQLTARYSYLDLNSKGITGGTVRDLTVGVNWFLNPNSKVQVNYFLADLDAPGTARDGLVQGFGTRLAWDF